MTKNVYSMPKYRTLSYFIFCKYDLNCLLSSSFLFTKYTFLLQGKNASSKKKKELKFYILSQNVQVIKCNFCIIRIKERKMKLAKPK